MSKLNVFGMIFLFASLLLLGYQGISALMGTDGLSSDFVWTNICLADFLSEGTFDWIHSISSFKVQTIILFLVQLPLLLWLFGIACLCFLIAAFRSG
ncbi:MAG: hypothetical protein JSV31_18805 [Desulfobacterales bacterium]|nr:MAG: hypothetical protein JSV31_18805 [Desulfobacterales bacterium]